MPVVFVTDLQSDGKPCMGVYDPATRVVQIRHGMEHKASLQVIAHEWIHLLLSDAGVGLADADEERVADAVATGIIADLLSRHP